MSRRPSIEYLRKHFSYDPETGVIKRISSHHHNQKLGPISVRTQAGYNIVRVQGRQVKAHRLAWALQTGKWPPDNMAIDHRNRCRSDNRWVNLALLSHKENISRERLKLHSMMRIPRPEIQFLTDGRWKAKLYCPHQKRVWIVGEFKTQDEAIEAVKRVEFTPSVREDHPASEGYKARARKKAKAQG